MRWMTQNQVVLSLICIVTLLHYEYRRAKADPPSQTQRWTWRTDQTPLPGNVAVIAGLRPQDMLVSLQDVYFDKTPFCVRSVLVAAAVNPLFYHMALEVQVVVYDGYGEVRFIGPPAVLKPWGFQRIPLEHMWDVYNEIEAPVVFDWYDLLPYAGPEPGFYIGIYLLGLKSGGTMTDDSPNLCCGTEGIFPGYDLCRSEGIWNYTDALSFPGPLAIRSEIELFWPPGLGDYDGDYHVDENDSVYLEEGLAEAQSGVDSFTSPFHRKLGLNNDFVLDEADLAVMAANYTGPIDYVVDPPALDIPAPFVTERTFPIGVQPPDETFGISNIGGYPLSYKVTTDAGSWLSITPASGVIEGSSSQNLTFHYTTYGLAAGTHQAQIRIDATCGPDRTPQFRYLNVTIRTEGDYDYDADIDLDDYALFSSCYTGPSILYASAPAAGCVIPIWNGFSLADFDKDGDVDMSDFGDFQIRFTGPGPIYYRSAALAKQTPAWALTPALRGALPSLEQLKLNKALLQKDGPKLLGPVFIIVLIIGLIGLAALLWSMARDSAFQRARQPINSVEQARVVEAINYLQTLSRRPGAHGDFGRAYQWLHQDAYTHAEDCAGNCTLLFVNREPLDGIDTTGEETIRASVITNMCRIVLRQDIFQCNVWTPEQMHELAYMLLAEWEHFAYHSTDEGAMQRVFEDTMNSLPETRADLQILFWSHEDFDLAE